MSEAQSQYSAREISSIKRRLHQPIVLVGLMGVGKSSVGRRLAQTLRSSFVDADEEIEQAAQLSIAEIFAQYGEPHFRDGERRVIARLIDDNEGVIATGGGAFIDDETRALILKRGVAVWIDCDIEVLVERTSRRDTRPILRQGDPREILTRLAKEREPFYREAPIHVRSGAGPHRMTTNRILEALDQWL